MITGASAGFGKAIAMKLAKQGVRLILTARSEEKLKKVCQEIQENTTSLVHPLVFDIRDYNACQAAIESIPNEYKPIDILINNAGLALETLPIQDGNLQDWEQMIDTNIKGLLYITRLISPQMVARKEGHIINIGSISSHEVYAGGNVYCATKHAVWALTQGIRMDLLPYDIRVTQISPGAAETEFSIVRFKGDEISAKKIYEGLQPLTAEDIADVIWYCTTVPKHVCINDLTITCLQQADAVYFNRNK